MNDTKNGKVEYQKPRMVRYGTLRELTEAGRTNPGSDFVVYKDGTRGSVHPPGLG